MPGPSLPVRLRLWSACIQSVLMYGLSAIMLDSHTAQQLRSHVAKQLRIVARSSAHLTHEPTHDFLQRLQQPDVITTLQRATLQRLTQAQQYLHQAQSKKSYRHPELMLHATNGQPACRHGGKRFASWRSFAGHFVQSACPVLHHVDTTIAVADPAHGALAPGISKPAASSSGEAHCTEPQPLFEQPDLQALATEKKLQPLADAIRVELLAGHCPVCRYKCNDKAYITRHACLQHDFIKQAEPLVRSWARNHSGVGKPCKWCRQTFPQTSQVHQRSCIVLWALGHFLHRFSSLTLAGQQQLSNHGRGTSTRGGGTHTIRGLCELRTRGTPSKRRTKRVINPSTPKQQGRATQPYPLRQLPLSLQPGQSKLHFRPQPGQIETTEPGPLLPEDAAAVKATGGGRIRTATAARPGTRSWRR